MDGSNVLEKIEENPRKPAEASGPTRIKNLAEKVSARLLARLLARLILIVGIPEFNVGAYNLQIVQMDQSAFSSQGSALS